MIIMYYDYWYYVNVIDILLMTDYWRLMTIDTVEEIWKF